MVTGVKPFSGKSQASLISSIMSGPVRRASEVRSAIPPELDRVIDRCLTRDRDTRWQSAHDLMLEIEWLMAHPSSGKTTTPVAAPAPASFTRERLIWIALFTILVASLAVVSLRSWLGRPAPDTDVVRFSVGPPDNVSFASAGASGATSSATISPDGRMLAFVGITGSGTQQQLFVRSLESLETRMIPDSATATAPFWSPDSRYIGFTAEGKLRKADVAGGRPETISDVAATYGASWGQSGVIVFASRSDGPLSRTTAQGGQAVPLTQLDKDETAQRWPCFLPDGQHYLYTSFGKDGASIWVASIESKEKQKLGSGTRPFYAPGYVFFVRDSVLLGQPFDAASLKLTGESFRITDQVEVNVNWGNASYSVSNTKRLAFRTPDALGTGHLAWIDRSGKQLGSLGEPGTVLPSLAPDQQRVVVSREPNNDLWMIDLQRGTFSRFTFGRAIQVIPVFSPDGKRVLFRSSVTGTGDLYIKDANGTAPEEPLLQSPETKSPTDWSPDGQNVMYETNGAETRVDLWIVPVSGERKPHPYLRGPFNEQQGRFSPDGHWVAYTSDESGSPQVYIQGFPDPSGNKWQISSNGGADPRWSRDGKELFYISADQKMMSVGIDSANGKIQAGIPKELFSVRVTGLTDTRTHYAVTQDSRRFLVNTRNEASAVAPITVVLNWPAAVKK
jgi:Tol biopolymer transport system component